MSIQSCIANTRREAVCVGVSDVELSDGNETFDYSAKNLITIRAEGKMIAE
jgi:hypothetical protein